MTEAPILTVGIVNYNARDWLRPCLESVRRETRSLPAEIVVVDNASSDGSVERVRTEFPEVGLVALPENRGYAAGCNAAWRAGRGRWALLLNPDVELRPGCLDALLAFADGRPEAGLVGPRLLESDGTHQPSCGRFPSLLGTLEDALFLPKLLPGFGPVARRHATRFDAGRAQTVEVLLGAFLLCRREMLERLDGLDERFFMYSEEVDLCWRASRAGWEIWYRPEGEAVHHGGKSTEPVAGAMFAELHRSKVRFFRHHRSAPAVLLARLFLATGALLRALLWSAVYLATAIASPGRRRRAGRRAAPFWHALAAHLRP